MSGGSLSLRNCREQTWPAAFWQDVNRRVAEVSSFFFSVTMSDKNERLNQSSRLEAGLHKLWYPVVRDMSTWSKFGAHGEHGDVFLFSNLGAL